MAKNISIKMSTMMKTRSETDDEDARIQRQKKQTRRPVSKIGRDRNHSGGVGTQFRPSPCWSKPGSDGWGCFRTISLSEMGKKKILMINKTFMFYEV